MDWLRDAAWQQGLAIVLLAAGSALIYAGARGEPLGAAALAGIGLFVAGVALPLLAQALQARGGAGDAGEDV